MASTTVKKLPKPNMAFIQQRSLFKHIGIAFGVSTIGGWLFKHFVSDVEDRKTEEFFATYNPWEDYERMRNLGLFTAAPPDDVLKAREENKKNKKNKKNKNKD